MYFSVYFGCAITIIKIPKKEVSEYKRVCSFKENHKIVSGDFCPICGSNVINKEYIIETEIIGLYDIFEKYNRICWLGDGVFMENGRRFSLNIEERAIIDEDLDLSKFDLDKFKEYAKDLIKILDDNLIEYEISVKVKTIYN